MNFVSWILVAVLVQILSPAGVQGQTICPDIKTCMLCVKSYALAIDVHQVAYDKARAVNKCNANMTETIVYDLSSALSSNTLQSRKFSVDTVDEFRFLSIESPDAQIEQIGYEEQQGSVDANGNRFNSSVFIRWLFNVNTDSGLTAVEFKLKYEAIGLVKEDNQNKNYLEWFPFGGDFTQSDTFIKDILVDVTLPAGTVNGQSEVYSATGEYNITTNLPTTILWRPELANVKFNTPCYNYEFDGDYKLQVSFDKQLNLCNKMPVWLYFVVAGATILGALLACSFLAFIFFEKPYECVAAQDDDRDRRGNYLDEVDERQSEEFRRRSVRSYDEELAYEIPIQSQRTQGSKGSKPITPKSKQASQIGSKPITPLSKPGSPQQLSRQQSSRGSVPVPLNEEASQQVPPTLGLLGQEAPPTASMAAGALESESTSAPASAPTAGPNLGLLEQEAKSDDDDLELAQVDSDKP